MSSPGPIFDELLARLKRATSSAVDFKGTGYRSSTPKYAKAPDLLTGAGSRRHGGRWNPRGIAVVYASLTPETAMAEALAHNRYYGVPLADAMPRTFVAIDVHLQHVLDFRDGRIRQRLQVSLDRVLTVDWRQEVSAGREPITHMIGRAASLVGLEGLVVPSAVDERGHNLLFFPGNRRPCSKVRLLRPGRLPP